MLKIMKLRPVGDAMVVGIPKEILTGLGWEPGDQLLVKPIEDGPTSQWVGVEIVLADSQIAPVVKRVK